MGCTNYSPGCVDVQTVLGTDVQTRLGTDVQTVLGTNCSVITSYNIIRHSDVTIQSSVHKMSGLVIFLKMQYACHVNM